jgi:hypothetical protein
LVAGSNEFKLWTMQLAAIFPDLIWGRSSVG